MLQVKDLRTGHIGQNLGAVGAVNLAWAQDGSSLFYTVADDNQRPFRQSLIITLPCPSCYCGVACGGRDQFQLNIVLY